MDDPRPISNQKHWDRQWEHIDIPRPLDPSDPSAANYFYRLLDRQFVRALSHMSTKGAEFIEIGCGASRWLPYFARRFGLVVSGIDTSVPGCKMAMEVLRSAGGAGNVVYADMFQPPAPMLDKFDIAASFGVVEHFEDTASAIKACAAFLKPGGTLITLVPTMRGLHGIAYRILNKKVFDIHHPLSVSELSTAHSAAGLTVVSCNYLLGMPGVIREYNPHSSNLTGVLRKLMHRLSCFYWILEERGLGIPPNRFTSPYVLCIARKS